MSDTVKLNTCPKCGAPIPLEAPQGLCPKCVLVGAAMATETGVPATATSEIPSLERVAAAFPQLEILELIGRGGMGFVFKARQPHLDRFVALKLLPDKLARDPRFAERFNREGRVLAKLNHPNIVSVYDFGQTEHFYFLLMELVDGVNLRQAMKAGRFSPGEALAIVPKVCEALQYAHGQGILHRDIKPENILLDARGQVKIADFGIAKLVGEEKPDVALTATGMSMGTPHYMAPEQLEHPLTVDHRADIYSLGVVFYEMLTGELPIGRFAAPSSKTPVGTAVDDVVFRTLEKDRERRYQSAGEVKSQVEHLTGEAIAGAASERPTRLDSRASRWHRGRALGWIVTALLLINFLGPHITRLGNSPADTVTIGLTTPWLVNRPFVSGDGIVRREFRYNFGSSAFYSGIFGILLCIGLIASRRFASNVAKAGAAPPAVPAWSQKAIWGAVLTGLSLPLPLLMVVAVLLRLGGLSGVELLLGAGAIIIPGLAGTILGWMALSDIRAHQGRLRGLPLALFAALACPLLTLGSVTLAIPLGLTYTTISSSAPTLGMRLLAFLALLIPVATITFGIWAVFAAARWGANKPVTRRRGVLKWIFVALFLSGIGFVLVSSNRPGRASNEQLGATVAPAVIAPEPIRINFRAAPGQMVSWQINRWDAGGPSPLAGFAGHYNQGVCCAGGFSVMLDPQSLGKDGEPRRWDISAVPDDLTEATRGVSSLPLGNLRRALPTNFVSVVEPNSSFSVTLTERDTSASPGLDPVPQLSIDVFSTAIATNEEFWDHARIRVGTTNWGKGLVKSRTGDATPWIRFTFTAVELREIAGVRWLAIDHVDHVNGECQRAFVRESNIPGFTPVSRTTEFVKDSKDSPAVRHQRVEFRMPDSAPREQLDRLRENLETALQQKSFKLELSPTQAPLLLFELPGVEGGSLKAWVKVVPPLKTPADPSTTSPLGALRLVAARDYQNLVLFRFQSAPANPLHQIVARFSGPELPPEVALVRPAVSGPYVVPSPDEAMSTPVSEPIVSGDPVGTNQFPMASAMAVQCPGDYAFTFILPDENIAREANKQLQQALAQPISLAAGKQILLFTVGERKAWLEARPFRPEPNKFTFFRHGGQSPALTPRSNYLENAVATIPPGHELQLVGRLANAQGRAQQLFSATLISGTDEPGIYWLTWYTLPNPQTVDQGEKEDWQFVVHDPLGRELYRAQAPEESKHGWHRRWLGELRSARVGEPIHQQLFEKRDLASTDSRSPRFITLEMTLQRASDRVAGADEAEKALIQLAREQLEITRKSFEAGRGTQLEVEEAQRKLAVAEARGDAVALAQANVKFAEASLADARSRGKAGRISASEVRAAEIKMATAEIELKQALQKAKKTPQ